MNNSLCRFLRIVLVLTATWFYMTGGKAWPEDVSARPHMRTMELRMSHEGQINVLWDYRIA